MRLDREVQSEQSQRIFWVIQTVFSVLLAKSLFDYRHCILAPISKEYYLTALGLLLVYTTALWSWIDYSFTTIVSPYKFAGGAGERIRFLVDLLIVVSYAYLLFSLEGLQENRTVEISPLLLGLSVVFVLYLFSGVLRVRQYGKRASRLGLIGIFCFFYPVLYVGYKILYGLLCSQQREALNAIFIILALILMIVYRIVRTKVAGRKRWIAVDVDGVLANQIVGILPIIKNSYGVNLKYEDITEWDLKIKDTDIAMIIKTEQKHREYVTTMPLHKGAREGMDKLVSKYMIAVVTSHAPETDVWTKHWLSVNKIPYDEIIHATEGNKQNTDLELNVLIDDYIGNIKLFLEKSNGRAVLFSQPWNNDHIILMKYLEAGRLKVVKDWDSIIEVVKGLMTSP